MGFCAHLPSLTCENCSNSARWAWQPTTNSEMLERAYQAMRGERDALATEAASLKKQVNVLKTKLGSALAERDRDAGYDGRAAKREAKRQEKLIRLVVAEKGMLRDAIGDLIDALSDELKYEVFQSPHVQRHIAAACLLLGDPYLGYVADWGGAPLEYVAAQTQPDPQQSDENAAP